MKNFILSLGAVFLTASMSWADVTTFVLDGTDDFAGLNRQSTTKPADTVTEILTQQDGVDFRLEASGNGKGFALVNAGGTNAGIYIAMNTVPTVTLTVPNGHITGATVSMTGYALSTLTLSFNGTESNEPDMNNSMYVWKWNDTEGGETLTITWPSYAAARYIHSISVTYTPELNGKEPCGLSFSKSSTEGIVGERFTAPILSNPNKLTLTWSSSNPAVASVDGKGKVTLLSGGTSVITASTQGNDQYASGNAKYTLTVIPVAASVAEMRKFAPNLNDRVKVTFPMTVYFSFSPSVYAVDENNAPCYITDSGIEENKPTAFKKGDIVPANWIAENAGPEGFRGAPDEPTETGEVYYQAVSSVTEADANKVLILKNVTFAEKTPYTEGTGYGTTPKGTKYQFRNPFGAAQMEAGIYDVTCVVKYETINNKTYFYLAVVSYSVSQGGDIPELPDFPSSFTTSVDESGITVTQEDDGDEYYIYLEGATSANTVTLTLEVPEDWDGFYSASSNGEIDENNPATPFAAARAEAENQDMAIELSELLSYYPTLEKSNSVTIKVGDEAAYGIFFLYKGDYACYKPVNINPALVKIEKPAFPESFDVSVNNTGVTVTQLIEQEVYTIKIGGTSTEQEVAVTIGTPEGWDGFVGYIDGDIMPDDISPLLKVAGEDEAVWIPVAGMEGIQKGNVFKFPADGEEYYGQLYLYKDNEVYVKEHIELNVKVNYSPLSNIMTVGTAPEYSRYFNLQGVEVAEPQTGIYIQVINGKARKVTVK